MYNGMVYGYQIPTSFGEVSEHGYGPYLGEVSDHGYGPYLGSNLGNIFDDITNVASKVGVVSSQLSKVKAGKAKLAVVPSDSASITIPIPGKPVGISVPLLPLALGAGALIWLAVRRRR